jgi:hypothetical protein
MFYENYRTYSEQELNDLVFDLLDDEIDEEI